MGKKEPSSKTLLYLYDPDETYEYNAKHGTEYPYNGFPMISLILHLRSFSYVQREMIYRITSVNRSISSPHCMMTIMI